MSLCGFCWEHGMPLMQLFLAGNSTPTIPHMFNKRRDSGFPMGCADAAAVDGRRGSNVYEVNLWLWQFGRGKPRRGGLSVEDTEHRKQAASVDRHQRSAETRLHCKADCTWFEVKCGTYLYVLVYTRMYWFIPVCTSMNIVFHKHRIFSVLLLWTAGCHVLCIGHVCIDTETS